MRERESGEVGDTRAKSNLRVMLLLARGAQSTPRRLLIAVMAAFPVVLMPELGLLVAVPFLMGILIISGQRPSVFEATLPVHGRVLLLSRVVPTIALLLLPLLAAAASSWFKHGRMLPFVSEAAAVAVIAATLQYAIQPRALSRPPWLQIIGAWAALAAAGAALVYWLPPPGASISLAVIAAAMLYVAWRQAPASFIVASASLTSAPQVTADSAQRADKRAKWWTPVIRSALPKHELFFLPLLVMMGFTGQWLTMFGLSLMSIQGLVRSRTRWLDAFPMSHVARLMLVVVPVALANVGAIGLGKSLTAIPMEFTSVMSWIGFGAPNNPYQGRYFDSPTRVRLEYWRRAESGRAPTITSPWGETATAYSLPVAGMLLYNPYSAREDNSKRFTEWQFARATTAVHGKPIPLATYEEGTKVRPSATSSLRMLILSGSATLSFALLIALLGEVSRWRHVSTFTPMQWMTGILPSLPLFACMSLDAMYGLRHGTQIVVPLVQRQLLSLSSALPANLLAVIAVAAMPVFALCALLVWQFSQAENVQQVVRITALDQAR